METKKIERPPRRLPLWVAVALSLALVGPTLAMSGNGQGLIGTVGKGVPLVFLIGLVGVALVGYGFVRLTRRFNHAGSVYALVGVTVGPRAGFFSGWAMLGAYIGFAIGLAGLVADFTNAFLAAVFNHPNPPQISWLLVMLIAVALVAVLAVIDTKRVGRMLMVIEGIGIVGMVILVVVIFGKGGAKTTGVDFSAFSLPHGVGFSGVVTGVVAAFLSWAGFEACAALGEETNDPRRNVPRALAGTLALTGVLFVVVMFAQTIGFGTDANGLKAFSTSGNTLGSLGEQYVNRGFGIVLIFAGVISAFACLLACASTSGRLLFAFSRDGFGPRRLGRLGGSAQTPREAIWVVLGFVVLINIISWASGWPRMGTGIPSLDSYFLYASAGAVSLMLAYLMTEVAAIVYTVSERFRVTRAGDGGQILGVLLPLIGAGVLLLVLWYNVKDQKHPWTSAAYVGLAWAATGLLGAIFANRAVAQMRRSLADELGLSVSEVPAAERPPERPAEPVVS
jgi:amino acid transporter